MSAYRPPMSVYRPPSYIVEENLLFTQITLNFCEAREVVILRNFNLPSLLWSAGIEMSCSSQNDFRLLYCCWFVTVRGRGYICHINYIIDQFVTSETDRVDEVLLLPPIPRSGHSPIVCDYLYSSDLEAESSASHQI